MNWCGVKLIGSRARIGPEGIEIADAIRGEAEVIAASGPAVRGGQQREHSRVAHLPVGSHRPHVASTARCGWLGADPHGLEKRRPAVRGCREVDVKLTSIRRMTRVVPEDPDYTI